MNKKRGAVGLAVSTRPQIVRVALSIVLLFLCSVSPTLAKTQAGTQTERKSPSQEMNFKRVAVMVFADGQEATAEANRTNSNGEYPV